ncbi:sulfite exporter TauE/SafE family protein [Mycolicibacterium moriokaense]|nr:sulfite exporter TauE/SafE family protein [Mycolicibacterium moriokaense]
MTAVAPNAVAPARTAFVASPELGSAESEISPHGSPRSRTSWAALVVIGVIGGMLSGLFAIGGAIVMVPLLVRLAGMNQRRAAATSLVAILPTAVVSSATYMIHADVDITAAGLISTGAIVGAIIGSRLLNRLPVAWLRWMFIAFLLLTAGHMLVTVPEPAHAQDFSSVVAVGYLLLGILTGVASGLFGIGGAIISVPLLGSVFALSDVVAKGTALLVSIPTSVVGTISNRRGSNPVDVRAGLMLGVTAAATSIPAVYVAFVLPPKTSAVTFAALLIAIAIWMSVKKPGAHPASVPLSPGYKESAHAN